MQTFSVSRAQGAAPHPPSDPSGGGEEALLSTTHQQGDRTPNDDDDGHVSTFPNSAHLLWFLVSTTATWVLAGILFMFAGIVTLRFALLPRIHSCSPGATCPGSFDPRGQILLVVQTIMLYWLRVGCLIAGIGIFRAIGYQAWFLMITQGRTVRTLELNLATVYGSVRHAALLLLQWKRRNMALVGLLVLAQLAIFTAVPIVVTRAISNLETRGRVRANFAYPPRFTTSTDNMVSTVFIFKVISSLNEWMLGNEDTHPFDAFHGSFIPRDNRTKFAVDVQPSGSRISGTVVCSAVNVSSVVIPPNADHPDPYYNISYAGQWMLFDPAPLSSAFLGLTLRPSLTRDNTTMFVQLLWATNSTGQLFNSSRTADGKVHYTQCVHTIDMVPIQDNAVGVDSILPSEFFLSQERGEASGAWFCTGGGWSDGGELCLKLHIGDIVVSTWGGYGERKFSTPEQIFPFMKGCRRGALTLLVEDNDRTCVVDSKSWTQALSITVEALMDASDKNYTAGQDLWIGYESIDVGQWWIQAIIPGLTVVLYVLAVGYVFLLDRRLRVVVKELSLAEVVKVTLSEREIQEHVQRWGGGGEVGIGKLRIGGGGATTARPIMRPCTEDEDNPMAMHPLLDVAQEKEARSSYASRGQQRHSSRLQWILFLARTTSLPVIAGIIFMFAGIVILRYALLPRIYTCPRGASCPHSFDPRGPVLRIVQAAMLYWLQAGCLLASIGLMKVIAYHGWFGMVKEGNTVQTLELKLATIYGSAFKAALLGLRKGSNRILALLVLFHVAISSLVALVINRSISNLRTAGMGDVKVMFGYPERFSMPEVILPGIVDLVNVQFSTRVTGGYEKWLLGDNATHPVDRFSRTLVVRDNRTTMGVGVQPSGVRMEGRLECSGKNMSVIEISPVVLGDGTQVGRYNITYDGPSQRYWGLHPLNTFIGASFLDTPALQTVSDVTNAGRNRTAVVLNMLWTSSSPGPIVNGTSSRDGRAHAAICAHTIEPVDIPHEAGLDAVNPTKMVIPASARNGSVPVCASGQQDDLCFARIVADYLYYMWGGSLYAGLPGGELVQWIRYCQRGALGYFGDPGAQSELQCKVDGEAWTLTLAALTDGLLSTSQLSVEVTQELRVERESISRERWWLQAVIPGATAVLYLVCVAYVVVIVHPELEEMKELTLSEIVAAVAADPDVVKEHVERGKNVESLNVGGMMTGRVGDSGVTGVESGDR